MPSSDKRSDLLFLLVAVGVTVLLYQVPYGRYVVYPFSMLATWFHEMGHGMTALLLGGSFNKIEITLDLGGVATNSVSNGFFQGLVALGGLLGPAVAGSALILLGRRRSLTAPTLYLLGGSMIASMLLLGKLSIGMWCIALFGATIIFITKKTGDSARHLFLHLLGVQTAMGVFNQIDYLFMRQATVGGQTMPSDVSVVADHLLLPVPFWSYGLTGLTVGMLAMSLYMAYRPQRTVQAEAT
jgi:hypothetical protein